jgi:hypothetical protein
MKKTGHRQRLMGEYRRGKEAEKNRRVTLRRAAGRVSLEQFKCLPDIIVRHPRR